MQFVIPTNTIITDYLLRHQKETQSLVRMPTEEPKYSEGGPVFCIPCTENAPFLNNAYMECKFPTSSYI